MTRETRETRETRGRRERERERQPQPFTEPHSGIESEHTQGSWFISILHFVFESYMYIYIYIHRLA